MTVRPAWPIAAALMLAVLAVTAPPGLAFPVSVRTGDHPGFARIVLQADRPVTWQLGRAGDGYRLRLSAVDGGGAASFRLDQAFQKIGRNRVAGLDASGEAGDLQIDLACTCRASAFELPGGGLVVDIADGAADGASRFELPFPSADTTRGSNEEKHATHTAEARPAGLGSTAAPVLDRLGGQKAALPPFWVLPQADESAESARATGTDAAAGAGRPAQAAGEWDEAAPHDRAGLIESAPAAEPSHAAADEPAQAAARQPIADLQAPAAGNVLFPLPDPKILRAEEELSLQLGRAATQGLIELALEPAPAGVQAAGPLDGDIGPIRPAAPSDTAEKAPGADALAPMRVTTGMDHGPVPLRFRHRPAPFAASCPAGGTLSMGSWRGPGEPASEIAALRANLVGEFDRADPEAVEALAKFYLSLGMGAEARQALRAFPVRVENQRILSDIGLILDGREVEETSPLNGMRDCETEVALWAFLAAPDAASVRLVDKGAIQRAFSELPLPVRNALARRVANRLIEMGAIDAARAIRNSVAREADDDARLIRMMDAERGWESPGGAPDAADIAAIAERNDGLSSDALLLAAEVMIDRRQPVPDATRAAIESLAVERHGSPDGAAYAAVAMLAAAVSGDIDAAFADYRRWWKELPPPQKVRAAEGLWSILVEAGPDQTFLTAYFENRQLVGDLPAESAVRMTLAGRLLKQGFAAEIDGLLGPVQSAAAAGRLLRARAQLAEFRPGDALETVRDQGGPEVDKLRADALDAMGDAEAAMQLYQRLEQPARAASSAWRAADWSAAAENSERFGRAISELGLDTPASKPGAPVPDDAPATDSRKPSLGEGRALVEESSAMRQVLLELITFEPESETVSQP